MTQTTIGIGFIGTGNIANAHADAIKTMKHLKIVAATDPNPVALKRFSEKYGCQANSLQELLSNPSVQSIHILTPPDSHRALVEQVAAAGKSVFVEKPIGTTKEDIQAIRALTLAQGQLIGVNQNFVFHPAMQALRDKLQTGAVGKLRHYELTFRPDLKQLAANQFSHWMFRSPLNLLLEQAVHPISQVLALAGPTTRVNAFPAKQIKINSQSSVITEFSSLLEHAHEESVVGTFHFGVGATFPAFLLRAYCDDATLEADMLNNVFTVTGRSAYLQQLDTAISITRRSKSQAKTAIGNLIDYGKSQLGLTGRNDSFFLGVNNSVRHFYDSLNGKNTLITTAQFGADAVDICMQLADSIAKNRVDSNQSNSSLIETTRNSSNDSLETVCVLGASGFIGKYTVEDLVSKGYKVRAVARTIRNLADIYSHPNVELMSGDVKSAADLDKAFKGIKTVVNLAHGGGGANFEEIRNALVGSAVLVAEQASKAGVQRIVHVGSIAGLYLGNSSDLITGSTPPDPQSEVRAVYARAKAIADQEFASICNKNNVAFTIIRPGVVVGKGTHPLHSGLGFINNEGHVVGWSDGNHQLPFVTGRECAEAIVLAAFANDCKNKSFNVVSDIQLSARQYIDAFNAKTGRAVQFHGKSPRRLWIEDVAKALIKKVGGKQAPIPNIRDFRSRAMYAKFDCSDLKNATGWKPLSNNQEFLDEVF